VQSGAFKHQNPNGIDQFCLLLHLPAEHAPGQTPAEPEQVIEKSENPDTNFCEAKTSPRNGKKRKCSDHHGMDDRYILSRAIATKGLGLADLIDNIHTLNHFPKDRVFVVEEVVVDKVDEEL